MPIYLFECPPQQRLAGYVEKIVVRTPYLKGKVHPNGAPVINPKTGHQAVEPDSVQTWAWLSQQQLPLPPSANFTGSIIAYTPDRDQSSIICVQITTPSVQQHAQIHAPFGVPVGSGGPIHQPPMADPNWKPGMPPQYRADPFEALDGSALPSNADPMLGEVDSAGGTFTDIDSQGNEIQRIERRPYDPNQGRR